MLFTPQLCYVWICYTTHPPRHGHYVEWQHVFSCKLVYFLVAFYFVFVSGDATHKHTWASDASQLVGSLTEPLEVGV